MPGVKTLLGYLKGLSTLQLALGVSVLFHATLLTIRFVDPEGFNRVFQDTPLEVILVNAKSDELPQKAMAIAQASLAGGGDAAQGRATSPLPPTLQARTGDAMEDEERRIEALKEKQNQLLAQVRKALASLPPPDLEAVNQSQDAIERERKRQALVKMLAEIEKRINEENARPRKRYVSPATQEAVYALYYDGLRRKIEERGTLDFPEVQGQKLYGELTMNVTVDAAGRVVEAEVIRPSQSRLLDQRALAIVRAAAPFGPFTAAMRREADQIVVTSRFRFTREDGFEARTLGSTPKGKLR